MSDLTQPPASSIKPRATRVRHRVVAVATLMSMLLYLDRFCISFVEIYVQEDLGLTNTQVGWMLSAFFWTYALAQVPTGWMTDHFGSRLMLTLYVLFWSLFTGWTGAVAAFIPLMALRFGFGLAQAGAYPTASSMVSRWVPLERRGTASAVIAFGGRVGGVLAMLASGYLLIALIPADTPTALQPADLMQPVLMCDDLAAGQASKESGKPRPEMVVRAAIFAQLDEARPVVAQLAGAYRQAILDQNEDSSGKINAAQRKLAADSVAVTPEQRQQLATDLNRLLKDASFLADATLASVVTELPLEKEARRLLKSRAKLTAQETERLNRLVLEAALPDGVRKFYGAGWRRLMLFYAVWGLPLAALIWFLCRTNPVEHPRVNDAELDLIGGFAGKLEATAHRAKVPLPELLASRSMWLSCLTQWFTNIGWVFLMTWAPRYFASVHELPTETRTLYVAIPPFVGWLGMLLGGSMTDTMARKFGLRWGRALPIGLSRFLAMAAYLGCLLNPSPLMAVCLFSIVAFSTDLGTAPIWAFTQDVGGKQVGSVLGWGNMWGNLGAAVTPPLLIWIVGPAENWNYAFMTCAGAFFLAGCCGLGINATIPIVTDEPKKKQDR
ncbi:MAG: MFS transporter [Planctomycetales bacterium]|nr:MFS transporter [Planctomycetales bacterium]